MKGFEAQQIYKDCCRLRDLTIRAQYCMTKADRITYGNELKTEAANMIRYFILAYGAYTRRLDKIDDFIGELAVFQVDFRSANEHNVIKEAKTIAKSDQETTPQKPNLIKNEIADTIARIDEGINKYRRATEGTMHSEPGVHRLIKD